MCAPLQQTCSELLRFLFFFVKEKFHINVVLENTHVRFDRRQVQNQTEAEKERIRKRRISEDIESWHDHKRKQGHSTPKGIPHVRETGPGNKTALVCFVAGWSFASSLREPEPSHLNRTHTSFVTKAGRKTTTTKNTPRFPPCIHRFKLRHMIHSPKSLSVIFLHEMMVTRPRKESASLIQTSRWNPASWNAGLKTNV